MSTDNPTPPPVNFKQPAGGEGGQQQQGLQVNLNEVNAHTAYGSFIMVNSTPHEVMINTACSVVPNNQVVIDNRLVMSYPRAKQLLSQLAQVVQRYEQAFGEIQLDRQPQTGGDAPQQG